MPGEAFRELTSHCADGADEDEDSDDASGTATGTATGTSTDGPEPTTSDNAATSLAASSAGFLGLILAAFAL